MKLFAQIGHGAGEKVQIGLNEGLIDGAIFSPKDLQKSSLKVRLEEYYTLFPNSELLIDPQFYLSLYANAREINIGRVDDWNGFKSYRKSELEMTDAVDKVLDSYFSEIEPLPVSAVIAPGIYISQSFDTREAVIAKNFIRRARSIYRGKKPLYVSLAVCREALQDQREFEDFLNDITLLSDPPDGFYLIVGSRSTESRSDIFHADIIANWMTFNLSLSGNGFKVINGYSDILTPFLGVAGGYAGATGWYSNLRIFSINRFVPSSGGRLPIIRYLSNLLLNRIMIPEKDALTRFVSGINNGLPHDADYSPEPERNKEILQSWEALKKLNEELTSIDICKNAIQNAMNAYALWANTGLPLDPKSDRSHLEPILDGLRLYKERTQI